MTTDNEKLCMAVVKHSTINNINWAGVGVALGQKPNSVYKRWKRFTETSTAENATNATPGKPTKSRANGSKKRGIKEVSNGEEVVVRRLPARKASGKKKAKIQTPISDEEEDDGEWAVKKEQIDIEENDFVGRDDEEA